MLPDAQLNAIVAEASGSLAKDTVIALGQFHRVHASPGYHEAAEYIANKAREYGLQDVHIESFPADGKTTYNTFRSYLGWEAESGVLTETSPRNEVIADYSKTRVALADYSNSADVQAELIDVGQGTSANDYSGKDVKGKIVLAGGSVAAAHHEAVEVRGAAGVLSYQPNQVTGWSGDYQDNVRWGHLSPYNTKNAFAFMISLRQARIYQDRLSRGEHIQLHAVVRAQMKPGNFEVVTGIIPGTDPALGEIVFSCHLCHQKPGANDNASGAATILEDARILSTLIKQGKLPRPRRTIRFIWPPEIAGTMCYFARHPDLVKNFVAAIHMDMVGGDHQITKAIFHITHTPASLPSFVNDVADIFADYVIEGSRRAAMTGDFSDAILSPDGSKEMLVADHSSFTMGSDHDVYEEGSFRIPTIYMNDWPDVFIHTNNDKPENLDATKLRRVAVIGAASGYFMALAGSTDAAVLADEVYNRGIARESEAAKQAYALNFKSHSYANDDKVLIEQAKLHELKAVESIVRLAPNDSWLSNYIKKVSDDVARRQATEFRMPFDAHVDQTEAALTVPKRNPQVIGNINVYYYNYLTDHISQTEIGNLNRLESLPNGETLAYETLNLADGVRSVKEIRNILRAAYGDVETDIVFDYLRLLEKARVITLEKRPQSGK